MRYIFSIVPVIFAYFFVSTVIAQGREYDLKDVNTELVVEVVGLPRPFQLVQYGKLGFYNSTPKEWEYSAYENPLLLKLGSEYQLRVFTIDKDGTKHDVTRENYTKYDTSSADGVMVSESGVLRIPNHKISSTSVFVGYASPTGRVGFGGFSIDVAQ
jgi:hypothetical protein